MTPGGNQVDQFVRNTADIQAPQTSVEGKPLPKVPFQTAYQLDGEQEIALVNQAMRRFREMADELGRGESEGLTWYESFVSSMGRSWRTHFGKRFIYDQISNNEMDWRRFLLGGIYTKMNHVLPLSRHVCGQMTARANNYFFGTDPWCAAYPMGEGAKDLSKKLDDWSQWKADRSQLKVAFEKAVELAFRRGENVLKTVYDRKEQIFKQIATVLVDAKGKDILGVDKDYITDKDGWVEQLTDPNLKDAETGLAVPQTKTGKFVLKRDLKTLKPAAMIWKTKRITRRRVVFKGAKTENVYYRDFLCSLNAKSVQEADCCVHLYDMSVMDLIDRYTRNGLLDMTGPEAQEATRRAIDQIRQLSSSNGIPKAAANQPRPELQQVDWTPTSENSNPVFQLAEFHMRYDADDDGIMEEIVLIVDLKSETPLFYDYEANMTPDGMRPFDVVRAIEVEDRWYGIGALELFEAVQNSLDLDYNRWKLSQSESGRVTMWRPYLTMEGDSNKNLTFNCGRVYVPQPGVKNEEILSYITLPDVKHEALKDQIEMAMQLLTNESGVANANDSRMAGLNSSELATGVRNIEKAGQEKFSMFLTPLERGLTSARRRNLKMDIFHMDKQEVYVFFEGDQIATTTLTREDAWSVDVDVEILMTRYRGEQIVQSALQRGNATAQFYTFPLNIQAHVAEDYRDLLTALGSKNAEKTIVPGVGQIMQAGGQPGQPGQSGTPAGMPQLNPNALSAAVATTPPGQAPPNL